MSRVENALREKGRYIGKIEGDSMMPMLDQTKDLIVVVPPQFPLRKYDVPVYHRGDHLTMHRIVKVTNKGYVICGDNRIHREYDITDREIVGVLSGFYHGGRYLDCSDPSYLRYAKRRCRQYYWRVCCAYLNRLLNCVKRK